MDILKNKFKHTTLSACVYGLIGLYFAVSPDAASLTVGKIIAIALLLVGVVKAVMLANEKVYSQFQIVTTAVLIIIGAVLLIRPQIAANFVGCILGIAIVIAGVYKFQCAMLLKEFTGGKPTIEAVLGIICIVLGIIALVNPFSAGAMVLSVIGIIMIITAVSEGITAYNIYCCIKKYDNDIIDQ